MKKQILFTLLLSSPVAQALYAQTRMSLYEEFTGEHCIPCATANPGLQSLVNANAAGVVHITYPTAVPAAGPIYNTYPLPLTARAAYYGITKAPQGRLDGTLTGTGTASPITGHVSNLTQSDIDAQAAIAPPFAMTLAHAWGGGGDSVIATVTITSPAAYAPAGASLKLRIALIEHLQYSTAPGINGEQDFPNVVRDMFPSASGTALPAVWTLGQSTTYTIRAQAARFADKSHATLVAWIQNDANKSVLQTALSAYVPIALDAAAPAVHPPARLICAAGAAPVAATALLRNAGTATLTSARIYYHADGGPLGYVAWTGTLAPGATTVVNLGTLSIGGGNHYITDSVVLPNGAADINAGNNVATGGVSIYNTTPVNLPVVSGFENAGATPAGWIRYDADSNGRSFTVAKNIFGGAAGYGNSTYFLLHNNYYVAAGEVNYAILPAAKLPTGSKMLSFAYAHAQYNTENDKLEIVYSTDCAATWTTVWSAAGAALSTAPPTTDYFIPTQAQWATQSVDVSAAPAGALIAFRATSDYGNTLYLDNVKLEATTSIKGITGLNGATLYPNPTVADASLDLVLHEQAMVSVDITDAIGRRLLTLHSGLMKAGNQHIVIPASKLPAGIYSVTISAEGDKLTKRLSVAK